MSAAKRKAPRATEAQSTAIDFASNSTPTGELQVETRLTNRPSWHDFHNIHPAAAFYHGFSRDEQLEELADDIDQRKVIFDPIHTASVFGKTFVIDGISRLDAIEKTGRPTVDEKGNWIGMLAGHVIHHSGKTDEEVWDIVSSLNLKRRHLTKEQIVEVADHMLKVEAGDKGTARKELAGAARSFSPTPGKRGGSTKDPRKTALHERAEKIAREPISNRTVEKYLHRQLDRQKQKPEPKKKGPSRGTKPVPFDQQVWTKWGHFLTYADVGERQEVKTVVEQCLELFEQWPADKHSDVVESVRRWLSWFDKWPVMQHADVLKLVRAWLEGRTP